MAEKILLVDDDLDTLRLVGLMLQRQGYEIRAANNGLQALAMAQSELPDLILLDVMMPEMDGYEVARRLRAEPTTANIPLIMFTAKTQIDDKVMGFEAGADDYLTKPTQPRELFAHMKAVLSRSAKAPTLDEPTTERGTLIGILAAKGGLGVSTLALNLGVALFAKFDKGVIVADFRPGQGTISLELGYLRSDGLNRLLQRPPTEITPSEIDLELLTHASGIQLLLASHFPRDAQYVNSLANFEAIARHLPHLAHHVVLDLGTSLTPVNEKVTQNCDRIIIVVEPVPQTLLQSTALIDDLVSNGVGENRINVVLVNRIRSGVQLSRSQVQERVGREIAVTFTPAPELTYQASIKHVPLFDQKTDSLTSQQFTQLAEEVA